MEWTRAILAVFKLFMLVWCGYRMQCAFDEQNQDGFTGWFVALLVTLVFVE